MADWLAGCFVSWLLGWLARRQVAWLTVSLLEWSAVGVKPAALFARTSPNQNFGRDSCALRARVPTKTVVGTRARHLRLLRTDWWRSAPRNNLRHYLRARGPTNILVGTPARNAHESLPKFGLDSCAQIAPQDLSLQPAIQPAKQPSKQPVS